jgi:hypothetical protein
MRVRAASQSPEAAAVQQQQQASSLDNRKDAGCQGVREPGRNRPGRNRAEPGRTRNRPAKQPDARTMRAQTLGRGHGHRPAPVTAVCVDPPTAARIAQTTASVATAAHNTQIRTPDPCPRGRIRWDATQRVLGWPLCRSDAASGTGPAFLQKPALHLIVGGRPWHTGTGC